jgi:hypothetical protein
MRKVAQAVCFRHRLVVVAASYGEGRSSAVHAVHLRTGAPLFDLNSSYWLLDIMKRQRFLELPRFLGQTVGAVESDLVLLYGAEVLFHPNLKSTLRLLQDSAMYKTVVVTWQGCVSDGRTISAPNGRRYPIRDFLVAGPQVNELVTPSWMGGEYRDSDGGDFRASLN